MVALDSNLCATSDEISRKKVEENWPHDISFSRFAHEENLLCAERKEGVERKIRRDEKWCEGKYFRSEMKMNTIIHGDMKEFSIEQIDSESRKGKAWFGWKGRQCASCVASWHLPNAGVECGSTGTAATVSIKRHLVQHLMGDDDEQQKS